MTMALPAPNLDDRRFQDLVDDAKRLVQRRCPEWTDHNVSDPGVTLIETFAYMVDQLLFRLNQVPERNYLAFLDLLGVKLFPPAAARAAVTFRLSAPQPHTVTVPAGAQVATVRNERNEMSLFTVMDDLDIVPCELEALGASEAGGAVTDHTDILGYPDQRFFCFSEQPRPGDALLVGLSNAVPSCAVLLRMDCRIEGVGVDPEWAPLQWEAWDGNGWAPCELEKDGTGGLNKAGDVVVHVPAAHTASVISGRRAGWLRCRYTQPEEGQPAYTASPQITRLVGATVGGTAATANVERVEDEVLGPSEGVPGQRFALRRRPVVPIGGDLELEVAARDGWQTWVQVDSFAESGPDDHHFMLEPATGEVVLGPQVRNADGRSVSHGAVPDKDATVRMPVYYTGGGRNGNVATGAISVLKSSIPYVSRVEHRRPARGGVDGETVDEAKIRGPVVLRTRDRAVTAEDYEHLCRQVAPEVARVRCVPGDDSEPGAVRVLVVPDATDDGGRISFEDLVPADETLERIAGFLDERRCLGARVVVEPPVYQGITVVARIRARRRASTERLRREAAQALYRYFHPIAGGPDGDGWPFGRPINVGEVYAVMQQLAGTELVEDARLFAADPLSGERGSQVQRIDIDRDALVFSYEHQIRVEAG
jgi:predicted phage baseplate assembly protein